jgi:hypothetical protein
MELLMIRVAMIEVKTTFIPQAEFEHATVRRVVPKTKASCLFFTPLRLLEFVL